MVMHSEGRPDVELMLKVQKNKMDMFSYPDLSGDCMGAYLCINRATH